MNPFKGAPRYGLTPNPETPYQRAGQAWDDRIGASRIQASNWRFMAIGLLALSAGLGGALTWLSARGTVTPWVVEVDRLGEVRAVGPAIQGYRPTDGDVRAALRRFIENVRAISVDGVVVGRAWNSAYAFTDKDAARFLTDYAARIDLNHLIGRVQVDVEVTSVLRASPTSFRATWIERRFANGQLQSTERWAAILTVELRRPTTDQAVLVNPLGLHVTAISWSREGGA